MAIQVEHGVKSSEEKNGSMDTDLDHSVHWANRNRE